MAELSIYLNSFILKRTLISPNQKENSHFLLHCYQGDSGMIEGKT